VIDRCFARHGRDYASLSATPDGFEQFVADVGEMMRTQPNYTPRDLAAIGVPVAIVQGEHDEFIRPEHAQYLARTIPGGTLTILPGVSHFAPLQRPARFNAALLAFLNGLPG
jgi:pimeloyl-ACP methyl ester carboxylesterase